MTRRPACVSPARLLPARTGTGRGVVIGLAVALALACFVLAGASVPPARGETGLATEVPRLRVGVLLLPDAGQPPLLTTVPEEPPPAPQ